MTVFAPGARRRRARERAANVTAGALLGDSGCRHRRQRGTRGCRRSRQPAATSWITKSGSNKFSRNNWRRPLPLLTRQDEGLRAAAKAERSAQWHALGDRQRVASICCWAPGPLRSPRTRLRRSRVGGPSNSSRGRPRSTTTTRCHCPRRRRRGRRDTRPRRLRLEQQQRVVVIVLLRRPQQRLDAVRDRGDQRAHQNWPVSSGRCAEALAKLRRAVASRLPPTPPPPGPVAGGPGGSRAAAELDAKLRLSPSAATWIQSPCRSVDGCYNPGDDLLRYAV